MPEKQLDSMGFVRTLAFALCVRERHFLSSRSFTASPSREEPFFKTPLSVVRINNQHYGKWSWTTTSTN